MGQVKSKEGEINIKQCEDLLKNHCQKNAYTFPEKESNRLSVGIRTMLTLVVQGIITSLTLLQATFFDCQMIKNVYRKGCSYYISAKTNILKITLSETINSVIHSAVESVNGQASQMKESLKPILSGMKNIYGEELKKYIESQDPSLFTPHKEEGVEDKIENVSDSNPILQ
tara:strand:+ start:1370 stop:1882 length:513 start_codon:yes stop_codon:yes gene_type:complete